MLRCSPWYCWWNSWRHCSIFRSSRCRCDLFYQQKPRQTAVARTHKPKNVSRRFHTTQSAPISRRSGGGRTSIIFMSYRKPLSLNRGFIFVHLCWILYFVGFILLNFRVQSFDRQTVFPWGPQPILKSAWKVLSLTSPPALLVEYNNAVALSRIGEPYLKIHIWMRRYRSKSDWSCTGAERPSQF